MNSRVPTTILSLSVLFLLLENLVVQVGAVCTVKITLSDTLANGNVGNGTVGGVFVKDTAAWSTTSISVPIAGPPYSFTFRSDVTPAETTVTSLEVDSVPIASCAARPVTVAGNQICSFPPSGCGPLWTGHPGGSPAGLAKGSDPETVLPFQSQWARTASSRSGGIVVLSDGSLGVVEGDSLVHLSWATGSVLASTPLVPGTVRAALIASGNEIYAAATNAGGNCTIIAVSSATWTPLWTYNLPPGETTYSLAVRTTAAEVLELHTYIYI